jgi:hypothetical protein
LSEPPAPEQRKKVLGGNLRRLAEPNFKKKGYTR